MGVAKVIGVWQVIGGNAGCGKNKIVIVGVAKGISGNGRCGLFKIHVVAANLWSDHHVIYYSTQELP